MPGKIVRQVSDAEAAHLVAHAASYIETAKLNLR
jgi:hypothetical protein